MTFFSLFFLLLAGQAHADQMYQCIDSSGSMAFQAQPCTAEQGESHRVPIPSAPSVGWQQEIDSPEAESQRRLLESIEKQNEASRQHYNQQIKQIDDRRCQYYRDQLTGVVERWETAKRKGYTQSDKLRYEARINDRKRDVARECS